MRIAVTGGTGFVGRRVVDRLRDGLPVDLLPATRFDEASIRAGLPPPAGFGRADLRLCAGR